MLSHWAFGEVGRRADERAVSSAARADDARVRLLEGTAHDPRRLVRLITALECSSTSKTIAAPTRVARVMKAGRTAARTVPAHRAGCGAPGRDQPSLPPLQTLAELRRTDPDASARLERLTLLQLDLSRDRAVRLAKARRGRRGGASDFEHDREGERLTALSRALLRARRAGCAAGTCRSRSPAGAWHSAARRADAARRARCAAMQRSCAGAGLGRTARLTAFARRRRLLDIGYETRLRPLRAGSPTCLSRGPGGALRQLASAGRWATCSRSSPSC